MAKVMDKFSYVNTFGALRSPVDFTLYGEVAGQLQYWLLCMVSGGTALR